MEISSNIEKKFSNPISLIMILCVVWIIASNVVVYFWQDTSIFKFTLILLQDIIFIILVLWLVKLSSLSSKQKNLAEFERYYLLFKRAPNPVWEISLPDLKILDINDAAILRYGYQGKSIRGQSISEIFADTDKLNFEASLLSAKSTGFKILGVFQSQTFSGEKFHVKVLTNLLEEEGNKHCFMVAYDIEQEIRTQKQIASSRDYFEQVLDSMGSGLMILDNSFHIKQVNPAILRDLRLPATTLLKNKIHDVLPSWKQSGLLESVEKVIVNQTPYRGEFMDAEQQKWFQVDCFPFENGVSILILDISHQKQFIEDKLIDGKTLSALIGYSTDIVFFVDQEKRLRFYNNAFENWYLEFVGSPPQKFGLLFQEPHMNIFLEQWENRFEQALLGKQVSIYERIPHPNKQDILFYHSNYNPLYNSDGTCLGVGCFARNLTDLKNNEKKLSKVNAKLHSTLDQIINGFIAIDSEMRVLEINPRIEEMLGVSHDIACGKFLPDLLQINSDCPGHVNFLECLDTNKRMEGEIHLLHLKIWIEYMAYPNLEEGTVDLYFNDITEKKLIENELKESLTKYELVAKVSNDIIWEWDFEKATIEWSHGLQEFLGYESGRGEEQLSWWKSKIHADDLEQAMKGLSYAIENNELSWKLEYRFADAWGKYHHIIERGFIERNDSGKPLKAIGTMQDTEPIYEKQQEIEQLYYILSKAEASVIITDSRHRITWVNDGFTKMTGYTLSEISGQKPGSFLQGPETDPETVANIRENLKLGKTVTTQIINYDKYKVAYWNRMVITPVFKNESLEGYIAVQFDVTKEVKNSIHIQQQNEKLREIAYISAHKLRGPVSSILGLAQVLELEPENQETHHKIIEYIMESSERLDKEIYKIISKTGEIED